VYAANQQVPAHEAPAPPQPTRLPWIHGPAITRIEGGSDMRIPAGFELLVPPDGKKLLALMGNPTTASDDRAYILQPEDAGQDWFMEFSYRDAGHVDDTDTIDADKLLAMMSKYSLEDNEVRKARHLPALDLVGWQTTPRYDPQTHRLEWAYRYKTHTDDLISNLHTRVLTRTGYYRVLMVGDVATYDEDMKAFNTALTFLHPLPGNRYSDFETGDKLARYGLMGLMGGGAAALAVKTGLAGGALALIVKIGSALLSSKAIVAVIAFLALLWARLKSLFSRRKGK